MKPRIMYIECKADGVSGPARIGRVRFSHSGKTVYYAGRALARTTQGSPKSNYFDVDTGEDYWISGCKVAGWDRLYPGTIEIDADVREDYWRGIRRQPERASEAVIRCPGKYGR